MRRTFCIILLITLPMLFSCKSIGQSLQKKVLPTPEQVAWSNAEIGVIIHLDIDLYAPDTYRYGDKKTLPPLRAFAPAKLNTDQWIKAAKSAGAKYAVFVAKHGTGFANWPSKANDYNVGHINIHPQEQGMGNPGCRLNVMCRCGRDGFGMPASILKPLSSYLTFISIV